MTNADALRELKPHEIMALEFMVKHGPDCIGIIDADEKMAAAIVFDQMRRDGLLIAEIGPLGPIYRITPAGRAALEADARARAEKPAR